MSALLAARKEKSVLYRLCLCVCVSELLISVTRDDQQFADFEFARIAPKVRLSETCQHHTHNTHAHKTMLK